jgi:hypothetical protein
MIDKIQGLKRSTSAATITNENGSSSVENSSNNNKNKLKDGPCAKYYALLEQCTHEKNIKKSSNAFMICVSETDLLIRCMRKNPSYLQS